MDSKSGDIKGSPNGTLILVIQAEMSPNYKTLQSKMCSKQIN